MNINPYFRLMRLDKPVGILLLWFPTAWSLWLANKGAPTLKLFILFFLGTVLMRSAGCVINDIADRHIDKQVTRTKLRPLTAGEVTIKGAFSLLLLLLLGALVILISLPDDCIIWAAAAVIVTFIYPFCKRFINAPQLVLGLAFTMGIPMAYVASGADFDGQFALLCLINFMWIVAYDTMYAMADKEDDLKIGVRSTAIYFASYDLWVIGILHVLIHSLWLIWAIHYAAQALFYVPWLLAGFFLLYQQNLIKGRMPAQCFRAFLTSTYYGAFMWLGLIFS